MSWIWHRKRPASRPAKWDAPIVPRHEERMAALYAWEQRTRGYALFAQPVALEPRFVPYDPADSADSIAEVAARPFVPSSGQTIIPLELPIAQKVTPSGCESLLGSLRGLNNPLTFEIIGGAHEIGYQMLCATCEAAQMRAALQMHLPISGLADEGRAADPVGDRLFDTLQPLMEPRRDSHELSVQVVDFGLYAPVYCSLKSFTSFAADPHAALLAALSHVAEDEVAGLQVLMAPAQGDWMGSLRLLVSQFDASSTSGTRPQHSASLDPQHALEAKGRTPLWAVALRVFAVSRGGEQRAFALCQRLGQALAAFSEPEGNELVALDDAGYPMGEHGRDLLRRQSRRAGMLLSTAEVAALVHPPSEALHHPQLVRLDPRQRPLPPHLLHEPGVLLGLHPYRREEQPLVWPDRFRNRHAYLLGATRMGKSTLLMHMIEQDLAEGRGLCLIDPHGDLAQDVLRRLPPHRVSDTLYLDLSDREHPLALGLLQAGDEDEKRLLVSDLLSIFHRLFASSWGDRLEHILRHVLLTLLEAPGHTLRDIRPLLSDSGYRSALLQGLDDPALLSFWRTEFPTYSSSTFSPLYNKLGLLLSSPLVRNIVVQEQSRLPIPQLMRQKQVLLVNLAQGLIGEDNAHFLGALLVSKLQIAAMGSLRHHPDERVPFTVYVDEFQHFVVSSFARILSEAGKAGLSLVMANQFLEQLNEPLQTAILSNVGTLVSFRVSSGSARRLEREFGGVVAAGELVDLSRGEAVVRLGQGSDSYAIRTRPPSSVGVDAGAIAEVVIERTRRECCRGRFEVEAEWYRALERENRTVKAPGKDKDQEEGEAKAGTAKSTTRSGKGKKEDRTKKTTEAEATEEWEGDAEESSCEEEPEIKLSEAAAAGSRTAGRSHRKARVQARRQPTSTAPKTGKRREHDAGDSAETPSQIPAHETESQEPSVAAEARSDDKRPAETGRIEEAFRPEEETSLTEPASFGLAEDDLESKP